MRHPPRANHHVPETAVFALQIREEERSGGRKRRAARSEDQAAAGGNDLTAGAIITAEQNRLRIRLPE